MSVRTGLVARRLPAALVVVLLIAAVPMAGCTQSEGASTQLIVTGSTTVLPIAEVAAESYTASHKGTKVLADGGGTSQGIEDVSKGRAGIGTASRDLKPEELSLGLVPTPIAHDAIAVIVNPSNPVKGLTKRQVADIFEGRITNWKQVGGPDQSIGLVNRDEASGTREAFWKIVLDKKPFDPTAAVLPGTGQVRFVVAGSAGAIGYISVGFVDASVKALEIDGVAPSEQNITAKTYPISRVLYFVTKGKPEGLPKQFTDYVLSSKIQEKVVRDAGFLPIKAAQ